jgi:two-component system, NarL family, response regulator DesR
MISVILAEHLNMVRGALAALLHLESDIKVVAEAASGEDLVTTALRVSPDVAVIDIDLPGGGGLNAAIDLRHLLPTCQSVILTNSARPADLRRALSARVAGFLLTNAPADQLARAIRAVAAGNRAVDSQLILAAWDLTESPLTVRETEILELAAEGADVPEIAASLHLTTGTVRNYLSTAVAKLNARSRLDAVRIAREAGWF